VRCCLVSEEGVPSEVYCPSRSDIEMNRKIRSLFHFCTHVRMSRGLDGLSEVWYGESAYGTYNRISNSLLGRQVRGSLLIITRNPRVSSETTSVFDQQQQFVDTNWARITKFLSMTSKTVQRTTGSSFQSTTQRRTQPKQEQLKQRIHIDAPALNIISNNTSMGSSVSVEQKSPVDTLTNTTRAYSGEGAFTYNPRPVKETDDVVEDVKDVKDVVKECYFFAQYGKCETEDCPYLHTATTTKQVEDVLSLEAWGKRVDKAMKPTTTIIPEKGVDALVLKRDRSEEEEEEEEVGAYYVPPSSPEVRRPRQAPPSQKKRRRSSRIAAKNKGGGGGRHY